MTSRVNLVAILLVMSCFAPVLTDSRSMNQKRQDNQRGSFLKVLRKTYNNTVPLNVLSPRNPKVLEFDETMGETQEDTRIDNLVRSDLEIADESRGKKKRMERTLMAMLLAYKMKFIALIPTMMGSLLLLKATALLAGFFFALFAAVLGLKVH